MEKPFALDLVGWEGIGHTEPRQGDRYSRQRQVCEQKEKEVTWKRHFVPFRV